MILHIIERKLEGTGRRDEVKRVDSYRVTVKEVKVAENRRRKQWIVLCRKLTFREVMELSGDRLR